MTQEVTPAVSGEAEQRPKLESLEKVAKRLRQHGQDGAQGPILIARELVTMRDRWGEYEHDEDLKFNQWVRANLAPKNFQWYERIHRAEVSLGTDISKMLHHDALAWLAGVIDGQRKEAILDALTSKFKGGNGRMPLTILQVQYAWKRLNDKA